jgi:septal ring factor EnvC (AmiA/AmiB activator)
MVASNNRSENVCVSTNSTKAETHSALAEWIKNIRIKKINKKRQSKGQDLRSIAILTNALLEHQKHLRQKQSERLERWLAMKKSMEMNEKLREDSENTVDCDMMKLEEEEIRQKELKNLFKQEIEEIDNFMNNLNTIKTSLVR